MRWLCQGAGRGVCHLSKCFLLMAHSLALLLWYSLHCPIAAGCGHARK